MKHKWALLFGTFFLTASFFGQIQLEDLKVDMDITGFRFAVDFEGTKVFTKNGPSDLQTMNPSAFSFTIVPGITARDAKSQLEMLLDMSRTNGYEITDLVKKDTTFNGQESFLISYVETDAPNNYKNTVFNAFVIKENTLILFTSGDLDKGKYAEAFKKTFYSMHL